MPFPAFEDNFKGHPDAKRALRNRSTAGMYAGSMEENNRRHTGGQRESNRESRIEQSADAIRERAVNVKLSACDHRAVQCRLIPFAAESVLVIPKSPICRCC
ncbi:ABC multidrug transporter AFR1 [Trichinella spiralis]|uniref:ABC multidrug transporter AFR1 n=1 Tax=Trichinella spiralis TaxID=6334 RepID=A0ABR3KF52_TRISP